MMSYNDLFEFRPCVTVPILLKNTIFNAQYYSAKDIFKAVFGKRYKDYVSINENNFRDDFKFMGSEWYRLKLESERENASSCSIQ